MAGVVYENGRVDFWCPQSGIQLVKTNKIHISFVAATCYYAVVPIQLIFLA